MKWYKELYIGKSIEQNRDEIISDIADNQKLKKRFLITLPANEKNMLDIITAKMGTIISWREIFVIGVAASKQEAVELVTEIISIVHHETNAFNLKEYFNDFI